MNNPVIERLMVRGSQVALNHVIHDMETRTLVMELIRRAIKRGVPRGDMDRRLKIPHPAKVECGFRTTPEEYLYDSVNCYSAFSIGPHNTIQNNASSVQREYFQLFGTVLLCCFWLFFLVMEHSD